MISDGYGGRKGKFHPFQALRDCIVMRLYRYTKFELLDNTILKHPEKSL